MTRRQHIEAEIAQQRILNKNDPPRALRQSSHKEGKRGRPACGSCGSTTYRDFGYLGTTLTCARCVFKQAEKKRDAETPTAP